MTAPRPTRKRLPRQLRLQRPAEFARIRSAGARLAKGCLIANWMVLSEGQACQLGVVTSRKLGQAVVRSRARRLLREAFRLHQHDFVRPVAMVLVARPSIRGKGLSEVEHDYCSLLKQAKLSKLME